jgi:hypothetical protein
MAAAVRAEVAKSATRSGLLRSIVKPGATELEEGRCRVSKPSARAVGK